MKKIRNLAKLRNGTDTVYRSVSNDSYAKNFSLQWELFSETQYDDKIKIPLSRNRLLRTSGWPESSFRDSIILEIGGGPGRFTRELLMLGANVITVDLSSAVEINFEKNRKFGNLIGIQANLHDLPLKSKSFERVLLMGVIQHTPNIFRTLRCVWSLVAPGGQLVLDVYAVNRRPSPYFLPKYFWRPITKSLPPELLLKIIKWYIPKYIPLDTKIKALPFGREIAGLLPIPCFNHYELPLTTKQRLEWAILDTFDALGSRFDHPVTLYGLKRRIKKLHSVKNFSLTRGHSAIITKQN